MSILKKSFSILGLKLNILKALVDLGYEKPTPIQIECIPKILSGHDILGIAQTGSGKTAAFVLPLLNNINIIKSNPQVLILTPTRELAIQVSNACSIYSKYIKGINSVPLYGGQRYEIQFRALKKRPQIIVCTPGRLLDLLKKEIVKLNILKYVVLDEADEMLRMGFIEDVKNILTQIPNNRQTVLFSATMPIVIKKITYQFMKNPIEIKIKSNLLINRPNIKQSYWMVNINKNDALMRFLEIENFIATIIFVRTKNSSIEINQILEKNGYNSSALNGDMSQTLRENTIDRLRKGNLNILIATDVAARGLDINRVDLIINYDMPNDPELYIHRIGRTGRAGREGRAIIFVEKNERRLLKNIEKIMDINILPIFLPKNSMLINNRLLKLSQKIKEEINSKDLNIYKKILLKLKNVDNLDIETISAVLLKISQKHRPLVLTNENISNINRYKKNNLSKFRKHKYKKMNIYKIMLGISNGIEIRNIVGAIVNEGKININQIGNIKLFNKHSIIELTKDISINTIKKISKIKILNKKINIQLINKIDTKHIKNK